jgi:hypothetical protein
LLGEYWFFSKVKDYFWFEIWLISSNEGGSTWITGWIFSWFLMSAFILLMSILYLLMLFSSVFFFFIIDFGRPGSLGEKPPSIGLSWVKLRLAASGYFFGKCGEFF